MDFFKDLNSIIAFSPEKFLMDPSFLSVLYSEIIPVLCDDVHIIEPDNEMGASLSKLLQQIDDINDSSWPVLNKNLKLWIEGDPSSGSANRALRLVKLMPLQLVKKLDAATVSMLAIKAKHIILQNKLQAQLGAFVLQSLLSQNHNILSVMESLFVELPENFEGSYLRENIALLAKTLLDFDKNKSLKFEISEALLFKSIELFILTASPPIENGSPNKNYLTLFRSIENFIALYPEKFSIDVPFISNFYQNILPHALVEARTDLDVKKRLSEFMEKLEDNEFLQLKLLLNQ